MFIEPREGVDLVVAKDSLSLEQLNVRIGIQIPDYIVRILEISSATFRKRGRKLLQGSTQELERVEITCFDPTSPGDTFPCFDR